MISVFLACMCTAAAAALFRGPSWELAALVPYSAALALVSGRRLFIIGLPPLALALLSPGALPWAILLGGMMFSLYAPGRAARVSGFLSVAVVLWFLPLRASIPLAVISAAGAVMGGGRTAASVAVLAGFSLSAFLAGLPEDPGAEPLAVRSFISDGRLVSERIMILPGSGGAYLCAPGTGTWAMWAAIEVGGLRDSIPAAAVSVGEDMIFLPAGRDTLCFLFHPGDTLNVSLLRRQEPLLHPVILFSAGGEKL